MLRAKGLLLLFPDIDLITLTAKSLNFSKYEYWVYLMKRR
jgi:hypothetical protein